MYATKYLNLRETIKAWMNLRANFGEGMKMWDPLAVTPPKVAGNRCLAGLAEPGGSAEPLVGLTGPTFGRWVPTVSAVMAQ